jgi:hypothetical protein
VSIRQAIKTDKAATFADMKTAIESRTYTE